NVEVEPFHDGAFAEADLEPAHADDRLAVGVDGDVAAAKVEHRDQYRIAAKNMAKTPSTTITMKIALTTDEVTWRPSDSAEPSTASPSIEAMRPMISAMKGALMMPTRNVFIWIAALRRDRYTSGLTSP